MNSLPFTQMRVFLLLLPAMLLSAFSNQKKTTRIVFFGDSLTEAAVHPFGFVDQLKDSLATAGRFELIGAGIGGNKVYDLFLRLEPDVLDRRPDLVVICIGINDVWHKALLHTGTDAPKFRQFYAAILDRLKRAKIHAVLCTPPCIGERKGFANALDSELNAYADTVRHLATEYRLPLCDLRDAFCLYNLDHNTDDRETGVLTTDGVHLNEAGNTLVAQRLLPFLKNTGKRLNPQSAP